MNVKGFKKWLQDNHIFTTKKQISDCVSRVKNIETKLTQAMGKEFDFDNEYEKNKLENLRNAFSLFGRSEYMKKYIPEGAEHYFPIGKASMGSLNNAILKYQRFRKETSNSTMHK